MSSKAGGSALREVQLHFVGARPSGCSVICGRRFHRLLCSRGLLIACGARMALQQWPCSTSAVVPFGWSCSGPSLGAVAYQVRLAPLSTRGWVGLVGAYRTFYITSTYDSTRIMILVYVSQPSPRLSGIGKFLSFSPVTGGILSSTGCPSQAHLEWCEDWLWFPSTCSRSGGSLERGETTPHATAKIGGGNVGGQVPGYIR